MKLVFRISQIGFALPVADLIEIREGIGGWLDRSTADPGRHLVGTLPHRGEMIPVHDLKGGLHLDRGTGEPATTVLVLAGGAGPWGGLVDRVEGIFPEGEFSLQSLPPLLDHLQALPYDRVAVRNGEPLVFCEPARLESCWGGP